MEVNLNLFWPMLNVARKWPTAEGQTKSVSDIFTLTKNLMATDFELRAH